MLSEHRNLAAAKRFFRSAKTVTGVIPDPVTTGGHDAYPRPSEWSSAAPCGIG
jgi:putative transposase